MTLGPGYRLAVAARFHLDAEWESRVSLGRGVEEVGGGFFPLGPWRPPTADELSCLLANSKSGVQEEGDALLLFRLPDHLLAAWWDLLDAAAEEGGGVRGFDAFAARVREFLAFKALATPGPLKMEVAVAAPGRRSIRSDPATNGPGGLGPTVAPWSPFPAAGVPVPRLHVIANLGDEPTGVAFVNLPPDALAAEVARCRRDVPASATLGEVATAFLRACPDYPPARLRLGPGEAVRLPAGGLILDGNPGGNQEPAVFLLVHAAS
jgi:hypothetical protein